MRFIAFLYFLLSYATAAPSSLRFQTPPPFPSLPAAVHRQDSADIWRRGLGAAKTGRPALIGLPYLYSAVDFFHMKFKHNDVNNSHYLRGSHKNKY
jgi:hypothetical protein